MNSQRDRRLIIIEGLFANFTLGFMFIWTVMRKPLLLLFPTWTEGMLSLIFGLHNLFICLGILIGGRLCAKFGGRVMFRLFSIMTFIGFGGFALLPESNPELAYVIAFILFCIVAATGTGFGICSVQSHTIPWFPEKSGMISGILYMALGLSSVILTLLSGLILPAFGAKITMFIFGAIIFVIATVILFDKNAITLPQSNLANDNSKLEETGLKPKEMLKSPVFWLLLLWNVGVRTSGLIMLDHVAGLSVFYGGITVVGMLISPFNALGCVTLGTSLDKLGIKKITVSISTSMLIACGFLVSGHFMNCYPVILIGILFAGFSYGGCNSTFPATIKNSFGARYYTENFGFANLAIGIAAFIESASGSVLDGANGNYLSIMIMMAIITVPSLIAGIIIWFNKNINK